MNRATSRRISTHGCCVLKVFGSPGQRHPGSPVTLPADADHATKERVADLQGRLANMERQVAEAERRAAEVRLFLTVTRTFGAGMRGHLVKEPVHGHALSRSRRRLFVLRDRELVRSVDESSALKGTIRLDGASVEREGRADRACPLRARRGAAHPSPAEGGHPAAAGGVAEEPTIRLPATTTAACSRRYNARRRRRRGPF